MSRRLALLSVSDKTGIVDLARGLVANGYSLLSTGGTAAALSAAGVPYLAVSDFTGFPEIFDGRVKTLHPRIHGGILGRRGIDDNIARNAGITWIDLVVVNLYPFAATVQTGGSEEEVVEQIDIGGPSLVRAAAKNHADVTVVVDPSDYPLLVAGDLPLETRRKLAAKAFRHTAAYDAMIGDWLGQHFDPGFFSEGAIGLSRKQNLRYGENPHQAASFYAVPGEGGRSLARAKQLQGKELSFNNLADLDAALRVVFEFQEPACVVVKHMNPCGAAIHPGGCALAYALALSADPVSAYGGIAVFNQPLGEAEARAIHDSRVFFEVLSAPGVSAEARAILGARKNLRVLELPDDWGSSLPAGYDGRRVMGGWLLQDWDIGKSSEWRAVVRPASKDEQRALEFAWAVCRNVKSNAITLARVEGDGVVLNGVGAGQMSRVDSVRLAVSKATRPTAGSVLASDAFFPFSDGVLVAVEAGITAIVQPGGSIRDGEIIEAATAAGVSMSFTDVRHFRH